VQPTEKVGSTSSTTGNVSLEPWQLLTLRTLFLQQEVIMKYLKFNHHNSFHEKSLPALDTKAAL